MEQHDRHCAALHSGFHIISLLHSATQFIKLRKDVSHVAKFSHLELVDYYYSATNAGMNLIFTLFFRHCSIKIDRLEF